MTLPGAAPRAADRTRRRDLAVRAAVRAGLLDPDDTPLAAFLDLRGIAESAAALHAAWPAGENVEHTFAAKANSLVPVLRLLRGLGLGCEVASPGELAQALAAGFGPGQLVLDSPAKTRPELRAALAAGVRRQHRQLPGTAARRRPGGRFGHRVPDRPADQPAGGDRCHRGDVHRGPRVQVRHRAGRPRQPGAHRRRLPGPALAALAARARRLPGLPVGTVRGRGRSRGRAGRGDRPPGRRGPRRRHRRRRRTARQLRRTTATTRPSPTRSPRSGPAPPACSAAAIGWSPNSAAPCWPRTASWPRGWSTPSAPAAGRSP
ncbi:pyridoxal-dependent decarboxylase-like protein [Streptomyces sp. TLI_171]|nr:pyridoxal-dependent decarboxylase-like protein [Streptomyces sp. TLI_171]